MQQYILPFLAKHNRVSIKGIGTFHKNVKQANWNVANQSFEHPEADILFESNSKFTSEDFIDYIALKEKRNKEQIIEIVNSWKNQPNITIVGLGKLRLENNVFQYQPQLTNELHEIKVQKTIRTSEAHAMTVGDYTTSTKVMQDFYADGNIETKRQFTWNWFHNAVLLTVAAIAYIVFYFYKHK